MNRVKVGCCGFPKAKEYYFSRFKLVEIQQTFYKPPSLNTVLKWWQQAPEDFEFAIKAWQLITHPPSSPTYRRAGLTIPQTKAKHYGFFKPTDAVLEAWERTRDTAKALQAKAIVFQCPASFTDSAENNENIKAFFARIDRDGFLFIWEPRGKWSDRAVTTICRDLDLIHCVDPLEKSPSYGSVRYFRLHGGRDYRHQHSDDELERLKDMATGETYVLFNNISMYDDALRFVELLTKGRDETQ